MRPLPLNVRRAAFLHRRAQIYGGVPKTQREHNYLPYSHSFANDFWNDGPEFTIIDAGVPVGLPGSEDFSWVLASAAAVPNAAIASDTFALPPGAGPLICFSAYIDVSFVGNAGTVLMQLRDSDTTNIFQVAWTYVAGVPTYNNSAGATSYGIEATGVGTWYRIYASLDATGTTWVGDDLRARFRPYGDDTTLNHGIAIHGAQINSGLTPTPLVEKP